MTIALAYTIVALLVTIAGVVEFAIKAVERGDEFAKRFLTDIQKWRNREGMNEIAEVWVRRDCLPFLVMLGLAIRKSWDAKSMRLKTFTKNGAPKKLGVEADSTHEILSRTVGRPVTLLMDRKGSCKLICGTLSSVHSDRHTIDVIPCPEKTYSENAPVFTENVGAIFVFE